jgi:glycerol-1-phosphate dehydrogenase [NAD(P)+]
MRKPHIQVPEIVRMKPGALPRLGLYLARPRLTRILLLHSQGLYAPILEKAEASFHQYSIEITGRAEVEEASVENAVLLLGTLPRGTQAIVGLGGGKALDVAKYLASLADLPGISVPTSLSNDGFCSPQASLTLQGRRRRSARACRTRSSSIWTCAAARRGPLWHSGIGDLTAKLTAVFDWKLAFHARGTPVNDLAALLSDATVHQFLANPTTTWRACGCWPRHSC